VLARSASYRVRQPRRSARVLGLGPRFPSMRSSAATQRSKRGGSSGADSGLSPRTPMRSQCRNSRSVIGSSPTRATAPLGSTGSCAAAGATAVTQRTAAAVAVHVERDIRRCTVARPRGVGAGQRGMGPEVFLFFSNNFGCVGSLVVSAIATLIPLLLLGVIDTG
jgi:hypothetical protein